MGGVLLVMMIMLMIVYLSALSPPSPSTLTFRQSGFGQVLVVIY